MNVEGGPFDCVLFAQCDGHENCLIGVEGTADKLGHVRSCQFAAIFVAILIIRGNLKRA